MLLTVTVLGHLGALERADAVISGSAHWFALTHPLWRSAMSAITRTVSTTYIGPVVAVVCLALLRWRRWRQAAFVAVAILVTVTVRVLFRKALARPGPVGRLTSASGCSFPVVATRRKDDVVTTSMGRARVGTMTCVRRTVGHPRPTGPPLS